MDPMAERRYEYAPANTLLGLLQRGRGQGALIASEDPAAATELVHACIRYEWAWEPMLDQRARYHARLVRDLKLEIGPIAELLSADAHAFRRALDVLALLAGADADAREALRAYVRDGERWITVLERMAEDWPVEWWDDLADTARRRIVDGGRPNAWGRCWERWGIPVPPRDPLPARARLPELPNDDLLRLLADPAEPDERKSDALDQLSCRAPDPRILPLVPTLGAAHGALTGVVLGLDALALPAAREWVTSTDPWPAKLAHVVLARFGDTRDVPALLDALERAWANRTWSGPGYLAAALARSGPAAADAASLLRRFWLHTPHSRDRAAYLEALAAIGAAGLPEAYQESLWDCEANARLLGVERAPDRPYALRRIADLRDDPMEEPEVRRAAEVRLAG
ncbi:hypothetical protein VM95_01420 [Streptomyces rubellomurinus]|uniref:HEAT repeat domain-containing protein n=2 Tax=Streptomyces rubellomurinus (strain ATCC 31215) TaxID=359131 RepID=A0A0F2TJX9_STRR3|nr:hypothetical protein VM95_01420 [Streptomyces rubellomurinus]